MLDIARGHLIAAAAARAILHQHHSQAIGLFCTDLLVAGDLLRRQRRDQRGALLCLASQFGNNLGAFGLPVQAVIGVFALGLGERLAAAGFIGAG